MKEVKHYKVKILPTNPTPNSVYYVKNTGEDSVKTYITDLIGFPVPLLDEAGVPNIESITPQLDYMEI